MRIGINIGIGTGRRSGGGFSPASLFSGGDEGFVYDPAVAGVLFQDTAGATPANTIGNPVGRINDLSGRNAHALQATAAARPLYARMPVGGRRNLLPNSGTDEAVVGVVGSDGALPSGWGLTTALTREVIAIGETGGIPWFDLRLTGTRNSAYFLNFSTNTAVPAADGQTWNASAYVQAIGSVVGADALFITPVSRLAGGATKNTYPSTTIGFPGAFTRFETPTTTLMDADGVAGNVSFMFAFLRLNCTGTVDVTLRLGGRQVEQASAATVFQTVNGDADITEVGKASRFCLLDDLVDDTMAVTLPAGTYTVATADDTGVTILTGQVLSAGDYTIPGPERLYAGVAINRALNGTETAALTAWLNDRRP
jgi:hypothetical protein